MSMSGPYSGSGGVGLYKKKALFLVRHIKNNKHKL